MATLCLYVKPTPSEPGARLLSVTCLGPRWTGRRLRLQRPDRLGLRESDLIGWSDFYAGTACDVHVARATDGERSGWLVWGGTLGLRSVPSGLAEEDVEELRRGSWDARPVLWLDDVSMLPEDVRAVVDSDPDRWGATEPS